MLPPQENGKSRLQQAQEDVDEVKVIMLDNLNKADERSGKLEELEDRAEDLLEKVRSSLSVLTASASLSHTHRVHRPQANWSSPLHSHTPNLRGRTRL